MKPSLARNDAGIIVKRELKKVANTVFDIIIVGGGIFGICSAWEAVQRGFSVVLLEKGDFSQATSANHFKMVHGGIRYLQHGDIYRIRESSEERSTLLKIAPHLVKPVPIVIPTAGHGLKGKEFLSLGFMLYDFLTIDKNLGIADASRKIPRGRFVSKGEVVKLFPGINQKGLTGAAIFYDGQIYNPPRLGLSFLRAAISAGADAANYTEVTGFLRDGNRICGVTATDLLSGDRLEIRGKYVLNTAGPWAAKLLRNGGGLVLKREPIFSRDLAFVVNKSIVDTHGLTCLIKSEDADAILDRGGRHIFLMPWRETTLIGVWHSIYRGDPDEITVTDEELQIYIDQVNDAYPGIFLKLDDISMVNTGLTLFGDEIEKSSKLSFGKRSLLIDHGKEHGIDGLLTLIGVRATTARGMAEKAITLISKKMRVAAPRSKTSIHPVFGGEIECFEEFLEDALNQTHLGLSGKVIRSLVHNYGSRYKEPLGYIEENMEWAETVGGSTVIKAEVVHAIRDEMAVRLGDVVFRRTDLGTAGNPGEEALNECAVLMGKELDWSDGEIEKELDSVRLIFKNRGGVKNYKSERYFQETPPGQ